MQQESSAITESTRNGMSSLRIWTIETSSRRGAVSAGGGRILILGVPGRRSRRNAQVAPVRSASSLAS
jgi:stage III sporulation protein SpoIIIAA